MTVRTALVSDRDWLAEAFSQPGATPRSVAAAAGCNEKTVRRWKARHGVASRPAAETASLRQAQHTPLPARTLEVLTGELLGDGSLAVRTRGDGPAYAARYRHATSSRAYLEWLADQLDGLSCAVTGPYAHVAPSGKAYPGYDLSSRSHSALAPLHVAWYGPDGKVVPRDVEVTSLVALHWYLGDGGVETGRGRRPTVGLATHGFTRDEITRLAEQLEPCRPRIVRHYDWLRLRLDAEPFLDFIGPCPIPEVYDRKWLAHR